MVSSRVLADPSQHCLAFCLLRHPRILTDIHPKHATTPLVRCEVNDKHTMMGCIMDLGIRYGFYKVSPLKREFNSKSV